MRTEITWDPTKDRANLLKHGIGFRTAARVFDDPNSILCTNICIDGEQRWHTIGRIDQSVPIVLVVHTLAFDEDGESIRVISARRTTPTERRIYEESYEEY